MSRYSCCNRTKGGEKNVIVMYTCKDNLIPLLYSGKIKIKKKKKRKKKKIKQVYIIIITLVPVDIWYIPKTKMKINEIQTI